MSLQKRITSEGIRFRNADRLVDYSVQWYAMIVSVVSIYDMCLGDLFTRLTFLRLISSVVNHLLWCLPGMYLVPRMGTEVRQ